MWGHSLTVHFFVAASNTKYFLYKLFNPDIQHYGLQTYGEIAYDANKLDDFLPILDDYRIKELKKYKDPSFKEQNVTKRLEQLFSGGKKFRWD